MICVIGIVMMISSVMASGLERRRSGGWVWSAICDMFGLFHMGVVGYGIWYRIRYAI